MRWTSARRAGPDSGGHDPRGLPPMGEYDGEEEQERGKSRCAHPVCGVFREFSDIWGGVKSVYSVRCFGWY